MKRLLLLFCFLLGLSVAGQQLYFDSATIVIKPGGKLITAAQEFKIPPGSTIVNNGTLELNSGFSNAGAYRTESADTVVMKGSADDALVLTKASVSYLVIQKPAGKTVTLYDTLRITGKLDFKSGILSTNYNFNPALVVMAPASVPFNFPTYENLIATQIIGVVLRTGWTNGNDVVFHNRFQFITTYGGTSPSTVAIVSLPNGDPSGNEKEVKHFYYIEASGGANYSTDLRFGYGAAELNNNPYASLSLWKNTGNEWILNNSLSSLFTTLVYATGVPAASLNGEWKLADPKYTFNVTAFLKGAWNNPTGLMRTSLNSGGLLPLSQPFNTAPYSYAGSESVASIPGVNIVDWVLLELRKPSSGLPADANSSTLIGRKAAFLLTNGNIVDLDGTTPVAFTISRQGSGNFIVVRHRNHLAVMSNSIATNVAGTFTNDFSILANNYQKLGVSSTPGSLLATSGAGFNKYGLWPGDVNNNGSVGSSDVTPINVAIAGPASGNTNVYNVRDVNMDKNVTTADISVTNASAGSLAATSSSRQAAPKKESHVPGEVKN